jgi:hypothetical protein
MKVHRNKSVKERYELMLKYENIKYISKDELMKFIQECMIKVEDEDGEYRGVYFDDAKFLKELGK